MNQLTSRSAMLGLALLAQTSGAFAANTVNAFETPGATATRGAALQIGEARFSAPMSLNAASQNVVINEIRIDQPGDDDDQFLELRGPASGALDNLSLLVLGDSIAGKSGVVEQAISLDGMQLDASGFFVIARPTFSLGAADLVTNVWFENSDNLTFMLVEGFTSSIGADLDVNDDGVLDHTPWAALRDVIAVIEQQNPPSSTEYHYGPPNTCAASATCGIVGPVGAWAPAHVIRCGDGLFLPSALDPLAGEDTPGADNACPVCGDGLVETGEACDGDGAGTGGETAGCNDDCTVTLCGDGKTNTAAAEQCDDETETATCNDDCTTATCGDGTVNTTAGEQCDDEVETATCNDDCTSASCGDGQLNSAAGEQCDDGIETATCNDDCTTASCGDGQLNSAAGEQCDDGNAISGDGCSATCLPDSPAEAGAGGLGDDQLSNDSDTTLIDHGPIGKGYRTTSCSAPSSAPARPRLTWLLSLAAAAAWSRRRRKPQSRML